MHMYDTLIDWKCSFEKSVEHLDWKDIQGPVQTIRHGLRLLKYPERLTSMKRMVEQLKVLGGIGEDGMVELFNAFSVLYQPRSNSCEATVCFKWRLTKSAPSTKICCFDWDTVSRYLLV